MDTADCLQRGGPLPLEALTGACRHLKCRGRLTEDSARFYAAEVLLALEYLHKQSIIYRDLKVGPANSAACTLALWHSQTHKSVALQQPSH